MDVDASTIQAHASESEQIEIYGILLSNVFISTFLFRGYCIVNLARNNVMYDVK